ncbi:IPT/TIG domain-containing protein [Flagellimonas myxillae]|uniref:Kelch repeat-containing protein n=1 Tax=Flagellimonas myxillae TaxID=2942214 RepID=UPI00201FAB6B|nr:IPT/TIG domain-containing protein [Muricauda myxillae]MCL6264995.1 IPT/TIG domain-containing protein [Muricauda myxillae]
MGKRTLYFSILLVFGLLLFNCSKDDDSKKPDDNPDANQPTITALSTTEGKEGDPVTISGTNFSTTASANTVTFGGTEAEVSSSTPTSISTSVPVGAQTGKIKVTVYGSTATSEDTFTVQDSDPEATITDFEPKEGTPGTLVEITGDNFGSQPLEVYFGDVKAELESISASLIEAFVPEEATSGPIKVVIGEDEVVSAKDFTVLSPITFDPTSGAPGESVDITVHPPFMLSPGLEDNIVEFNGITAVILDIQDNHILVEVPESATTGPISVTNGENQSVESTMDFTVLPWRQLGNIGGEKRRQGVAVTVNNMIYMVLGYTESGDTNMELWEFDSTTQTWTQKPNLLAQHRIAPFAFAIGDNFYLGGGQSTIVQQFNDFWKFDPAANNGNGQWIQLNDFKDNEDPNRFYSSSFTIGEKAYVYGGSITVDTFHNNLLEYDPSEEGTWTEKAGFDANGRKQAIGFSLNGKGYIALGEDQNELLNDIWEYDPYANNGDGSWTKKTNFPGELRDNPLCFVANGKAYIGMGRTNQGVNLNDLWEFDSAGNGTWTKKGDFEGIPRKEAMSTGINGKGYVFGGYDEEGSQYLGDFWEYDPAIDIE